MYTAAGFVGLAGGLEGSTKGYNPGELGEWIMIRGGIAECRRNLFASPSQQEKKEWLLEPLCRAHFAGLCLLLNAFPGRHKLRSLDVDEGVTAEAAVIDAIELQATGEGVGVIALDPRTRTPQALSFYNATTRTLATYQPPALESAGEAAERAVLTALVVQKPGS